ncbi:cell envelope integrity protein TolA [Enterovibrio makurazakiensis]|uniref:cell envelope integrity protein TolA n=1 Tax=Enterovibrio makurazakiensis TaxID=2910232 RepID=UPI003D1D6380
MSLLVCFVASACTSSNSEVNSRSDTSELKGYEEIYQQKIQLELILTKKMLGKIFTLDIQLSTTGLALSVVSSGDRELCKAGKHAVYRVGTFPMPRDENLANELRHLRLNITP